MTRPSAASLLQSAMDGSDRIVRTRRDLHAMAEPGFCEYGTALYVYRRLVAAGWNLVTGDAAMDRTVALSIPHLETERAFEAARAELADDPILLGMRGGATALVATRTFGPGPTIAFRFDLDALPLPESTSSEHLPARLGFASRAGCMHACGHDGHMAIGLGLAELLVELADNLSGTVKLLFQPAEEGTRGGAAAMVAKGHVDDVDLVFCAHLGLEASETGTVIAGAQFMATSKYTVRIHGRTTHVLHAPQEGHDALLAAVAIVQQTRALPPHADGWYSLFVPRLEAGATLGGTPASAELDLSFWATTSAVQQWVNERILAVVEGARTAFGVEIEIVLIGEAPSVPIDSELTAELVALALQIPGVNAIAHVNSSAGEDGNIFIERVRNHGGRGAFVLIGTRLADDHHTSTFDIDEASLPIGAAYLANIAVHFLTPPRRHP